jgi:hypothetical protein
MVSGNPIPEFQALGFNPVAPVAPGAPRKPRVAKRHFENKNNENENNENEALDAEPNPRIFNFGPKRLHFGRNP